MKYNAKELAEMALRNVSSAKKCTPGKDCLDPVDCVAKVFDAPLTALATAEQDLTDTRAKLNHADRLIEMFAQNIGGAVQIADPLIVQAAERYLGRTLTGPASNN